jgi:hypothetical protein
MPRPSASPSSRTRPCALFAPHLVPCGNAWHPGAPGVLRRGVGAPLGGLLSSSFFLGETTQNKIEGNTTTFLLSRTTLRFFFGILTTPWRKNSTSEGLLRPGALAPIGLTAYWSCKLINHKFRGDFHFLNAPRINNRPLKTILSYAKLKLNRPVGRQRQPKKNCLASARLAPIATLASATSFANPAFSYLAVVLVSAFRGVQSPGGEKTEISLL